MLLLSPGSEFPTSSIETCLHQCRQIFPFLSSLSSVVNVNQAYILNDLCFCTNETLDIQTCPLANPCVVTSTICPAQLVDHALFEPLDDDDDTNEFDFEVTIPDVAETLVPVEIQILSNTGFFYIFIF